MAPFLDVRPEERRGALAAFVTLLGVTAGHTLLETARDALFLAKLPVSRLPWVYLAIAGVGLVLARVGRRSPSRSGEARASRGLPSALLAAAAVTAGFWVLTAIWQGSLLFYALYVWTGLFASWIVVAFWLLLGESFTVGQAKRLYSVIGAGSVLGAVLGAGLARALASVLAASWFVLVAAGIFVATALGPAMRLGALGALEQPAAARSPSRVVARAQVDAGAGSEIAGVVGDPYVKRILALVLLATMALTTVDYVFKSAVAREIPKAQLGAFFATVSVVLNASALVVQLFGVGLVFRTLRVHQALWIMPALLLLGSGGVLAGGGLVAAVLLRGVDGSLRHSLHRTSTELLCLPIPDAARARSKPWIDLLGQRGGQALASLAILALVALGAGERALALLVAVLAIGWITVAAAIKRPYTDAFRTSMREGRMALDGEVPVFDLGALEALFSALNSKKDPEVLGALELLAAQERQRLIPALILYHPSKAVVLRAFELFARLGRDDFVPIADRLLHHADPEVRAAALRARTAVQPDETFLRSLLADPNLEVRATAVVGLVGRGALAGGEAEEAVLALRGGTLPVRLALARAVAEDPSPLHDDVLVSLARDPEVDLKAEVATAMGRGPSPRFVAILVELLAYRELGPEARAALVAHGEPALGHLDRVLSDPSAPAEVRRGAARAISEFPAAEAVPILERQLDGSVDGMVRFRILRALSKLRADEPALALGEAVLGRAIEEALGAARRSLAFRLALERGQADDPRRDTPAGNLLRTLLGDKEAHAIGRLFKVLGLLYPRENFGHIHRALQGKRAKVRASSLELLENVVAPPLRERVLALVEERPDAERLARAGGKPWTVGYADLLGLILERGGELASLAAYHGAELGLAVAPPRAAAEDGAATAFAAAVALRAREIEAARAT